MKFIVKIGLLFFLSFSIRAQQSPLHLDTWHDDKEVWLKWTPTDTKTFYDGVKYGYRIARYTIEKDGKKLKPEAIRFLVQEPLKPADKEAFQKNKEDVYVQMAGELLYYPKAQAGETQADIDKERFLYSQLATNMSFEASKLMGLGFVDKTVRKNEKYRYVVTLADPASNSVKAAAVSGLSERVLVPLPENLRLQYKDSVVTYTFDIGDYLTYNLERSDDDGVTFKKVNAQPIVATFTEGDTGSTTIYMDKIDQLHKRYYYRVRAITPFGKETPPSNEASVYTYQTELPPPRIYNHEFVFGNTLLYWQFPDSLTANITGYKLTHRITLDDSLGRVLTSTPIAPVYKQYYDTTSHESGFYQLSLIDLQGYEIHSDLYYVDIHDSIPPLKPILLADSVTKEGVVTINWKSNREKDFFGYRVYRSNSRNGMYELLKSEPTRDTVVIDTIPLKLLNKHVYYTVVALDYHMNASVNNDTLEIKRPDIIPPTSPIIERFMVSDTSINLYWRNSTSDDLSETRLWRWVDGDSVKTLLASFKPGSPLLQWTDLNIEEKVLYVYNLEAVDDSGNSSGELTSVKLRIESPYYRKAVDVYKAGFDKVSSGVMLNWKAPAVKIPVKYYILYRKENEGGMKQLLTLNQQTLAYADTRIKGNARYAYAVVAYFEDDSRTILKATPPIQIPDL
jgi:hypothetical protein